MIAVYVIIIDQSDAGAFDDLTIWIVPVPCLDQALFCNALDGNVWKFTAIGRSLKKKHSRRHHPAQHFLRAPDTMPSSAKKDGGTSHNRKCAFVRTGRCAALISDGIY